MAPKKKNHRTTASPSRPGCPIANISSPNQTKQPKRKKKKNPHPRVFPMFLSNRTQFILTHSLVVNITCYDHTSFKILTIFFAPGYDRESIDPEWRARARSFALASESSTHCHPVTPLSHLVTDKLFQKKKRGN